MNPGIGLIKRRLEKENQAVALATSHILKEYGGGDGSAGLTADSVSVLETKYDTDSGDWYVALGWKDGNYSGNYSGNDNDDSDSDNDDNERRVVVQMDSILGTVTGVREL